MFHKKQNKTVLWKNYKVWWNLIKLLNNLPINRFTRPSWGISSSLDRRPPFPHYHSRYPHFHSPLCSHFHYHPGLHSPSLRRCIVHKGGVDVVVDQQLVDQVPLLQDCELTTLARPRALPRALPRGGLLSPGSMSSLFLLLRLVTWKKRKRQILI